MTPEPMLTLWEVALFVLGTASTAAAMVWAMWRTQDNGPLTTDHTP